MMTINETTLSFLLEDCIKEFGTEKGEKFFQRTEQIYQNLLDSADYKNSEVIREHLQRKLFPPMAYYKTLIAEGYDKSTALDYVEKETRKAALAKKEKNARACKNALCLYHI